jgi:hypothetical protein
MKIYPSRAGASAVGGQRSYRFRGAFQCSVESCEGSVRRALAQLRTCPICMNNINGVTLPFYLVNSSLCAPSLKGVKS